MYDGILKIEFEDGQSKSIGSATNGQNGQNGQNFQIIMQIHVITFEGHDQSRPKFEGFILMTFFRSSSKMINLGQLVLPQITKNGQNFQK